MFVHIVCEETCIARGAGVLVHHQHKSDVATDCTASKFTSDSSTIKTSSIWTTHRGGLNRYPGYSTPEILMILHHLLSLTDISRHYLQYRKAQSFDERLASNPSLPPCLTILCINDCISWLLMVRLFTGSDRVRTWEILLPENSCLHGLEDT